MSNVNINDQDDIITTNILNSLDPDYSSSEESWDYLFDFPSNDLSFNDFDNDYIIEYE